MTTFLYAHGFKSASRSRKANELRAYLEAHRPDVRFVCPDLAFRPAAAIAQLRAAAREMPTSELTVVGSSLGGFYAAVLAEELGCRAVLLNPSLRPFETLARYLGEQVNMYTGERFVFDRTHIAELEAMAPTSVSRPERYLVIVEMGDELLDHEKTLAHFAHAKHIVVEGGDHELKSFPRHIPALMAFAG